MNTMNTQQTAYQSCHNSNTDTTANINNTNTTNITENTKSTTQKLSSKWHKTRTENHPGRNNKHHPPSCSAAVLVESRHPLKETQMNTHQKCASKKKNTEFDKRTTHRSSHVSPLVVGFVALASGDRAITSQGTVHTTAYNDTTQ